MNQPYPLWRPELTALKERGYRFEDPSEVVELFEQKIAHWTAAPYAVATDCATHAMELCLRYTGPWGEVTVPKHTYISVPQTLRKLNIKVQWSGEKWEGLYQLSPTPVYDASLRFRENMYEPDKFLCLSFQIKKRLPIGRGGMILTDDKKAYDWLKRAVYDGRTPNTAWRRDVIPQMGYHYYMTPEDAARGILLFDQLLESGFETTDLWPYTEYPDLTSMEYFQRINEWS